MQQSRKARQIEIHKKIMQHSRKARQIEIRTAKSNRNIDPSHKHDFTAKQAVLYYT
jgi:hypothetical protein